ncbi:L-rhamnose-binding lectin CSL3-like [Ostrea edulis]|uniref:L-rhamnose-binding lectin CSL3-like n=1 Tax=Ostrea edulis TaxID=37623 RepID=UPI0024AF13D5|nr:L-rhamnose-binding lectin CSL3-like [Ostrea edulis]
MLPKIIGFVFLIGYTKAITELACEGDSLQLSCPRGQSINVTYANYGRTRGYPCPAPGLQDTSCYSRFSLQTVRENCQDQNQCSVSASDYIFGDPCPNTYKYLEVTYQCELPQSQGTRFHVCEGGTLYLYCPRDAVLVVFSANYGRRDSTTCPAPGPQNTICVSPNSVSRVRSYCEGRQRCQLEATNAMFDDFCPGTYKYLEVYVGCTYYRQ